MEHTKNPIDEYIARFPDTTRDVLKQVRRTIKQVIPDATEVISYGVPTFKLQDKYVIYFGGYEHHVSIYPLPTDEQLRREIEPFAAGKGTARFPLDKPVPYDLIKRMALALLKDHHDRLSKK